MKSLSFNKSYSLTVNIVISSPWRFDLNSLQIDPVSHSQRFIVTSSLWLLHPHCQMNKSCGSHRCCSEIDYSIKTGWCLIRRYQPRCQKVIFSDGELWINTTDCSSSKVNLKIFGRKLPFMTLSLNGMQSSRKKEEVDSEDKHRTQSSLSLLMIILPSSERKTTSRKVLFSLNILCRSLTVSLSRESSQERE